MLKSLILTTFPTFDPLMPEWLFPLLLPPAYNWGSHASGLVLSSMVVFATQSSSRALYSSNSNTVGKHHKPSRLSSCINAIFARHSLIQIVSLRIQGIKEVKLWRIAVISFILIQSLACCADILWPFAVSVFPDFFSSKTDPFKFHYFLNIRSPLQGVNISAQSQCNCGKNKH